MDNLPKYGPIDVVFSFCSYILESVKIIDAHVHLGSWPNIETSKANLLYGMNAYGIASGILSHADCSTFPGDAGAFATPISAAEGLRQCIEFAREHPGRFHLAVWIKPLVEPRPSEELFSLIRDNRDLIVALKLHPFCERISPCDERLEPYYELAAELNMPVLCHTALDFHSSIGELILAANAHPNLRFVAAHLELSSDHHYSINALKSTKNVYADTAWVDMKSARLAMEEVGVDRVMFGTDSPLDGPETLANPLYFSFLNNTEHLPEDIYERLMSGNAKAFYGID